MSLFRKAMMLCASAFAMAVALGAAASAQLGAVTTTSQHREQTLKDTPVAVSVVTAEAIEDAALRDLTDLQTLVPSLNVHTYSRPGAVQHTIRGLGGFSDNPGLEPSVGMFVDGVYRARPGELADDLLFVERVEVLRGPQSVLYGRNASAGVISVLTQRPAFEVEAAGEFTYASDNQLITKGAVTGPLLRDQLAFRLDASFNKRDGVLTDRTSSENTQDINNRNRFELRGQLLWEPDDRTNVRLIADYGEIDEDCCAAPFLSQPSENRLALGLAGAGLRADDPFRREVVFDAPLNTVIENSGVSVQVDREFERFELTSITSFRNYEEDSALDADFTDVELAAPKSIEESYNAFTQEVRITQRDGGRYDWLGGATLHYQALSHDTAEAYGAGIRTFLDSFVQDAISDLENFLEVDPLTYFAPGQGVTAERYDQDTLSLSAFGQADYYVNEKLTVTGGLRLSIENKDVDADIAIDDPFSQIDFSTLDLVAIAEPLFFDEIFRERTFLEPTDLFIGLTPPDELAEIRADAAAAAADPDVNQLFRLPGLQFYPDAAGYSDSQTDFNISAMLRADYQVNENLEIYAGYSRGYTAAGYNLSVYAARDGVRDFDNEVSTTLEFGLKTRFARDTMALNFTAFDTSVDDFQAESFTGTSLQIVNAGGATVRGLELKTDWKPNPYFLGELGLTYLLDSEFDSFTNAPCNGLQLFADACPTGVQDLSGRQLPGASKTTIHLAGTLMFSVSGLNVSLRNEGYFRSAYNLSADLDPRTVQDESFLYNATLTIAPPREGWALQLWGKNLLNEEYLTGAFAPIYQTGSVSSFVGDPRAYGLTLRLAY